MAGLIQSSQEFAGQKWKNVYMKIKKYINTIYKSEKHINFTYFSYFLLLKY